MNKFTIPGKIKEIEKLPNPDDRRKAFTALARGLEVPAEEDGDTATAWDEPEFIKKINDVYKKHISGLTVKIGFLLIILSGINAIVKSCRPV